MRAAAIDVGTNSIKMVVGESDPEGNIIILHESSVNARLGQGLASTGLIAPEALKRGLDAIGAHLSKAREFDADEIRIVGTNVIRDAANSSELIQSVKRLYSVDLEKLSGDDEARYAFLAIAGDSQLGFSDDLQMIIDTGGGSTEMISGVGSQMLSSVSVNIGAVRVTETYLKEIPAKINSLIEARVSVKKSLIPYLEGKKPNRLICIGGSAINLARIYYKIEPAHTTDVHALKLSLKSIEELIGKLAQMNLNERKSLIGLEPERADIILGGALIIEQIISILDLQEVIISVRGLRHAVLFEMLGFGRQRSLS